MFFCFLWLAAPVASLIAEIRRNQLAKEFAEKLKETPDSYYYYDGMVYLNEKDLADEICREVKRRKERQKRRIGVER